ncbi:hypothetical protein A2974_01770 [Candidatus Peregrinibacteria bacterium RIFCSPLOWO2_01_FULL_48_20]|nr:MAG: hypothetical protein A2974_01770 [Candidatus Peregrinibacteria bacterium RIFCSPLOWO2_01_FULL_48_20]
MELFNRLNQVLNLSPREWPRVLVAFGMVFLSRAGAIIGGSILLALFLTHIGIELLPLLFLTNAVLMIIGTVIYRNLIHRIRQELLITATVLFASALLVASILFLGGNTVIFYSLFLFAGSVLLSQLNILISLFNEELFTPLESQRTFPVIESAETLGGIMGGLLLTVFANNLPSYKFILIWVILLLCILPIVLRYNARTMEIPKLKEEYAEATTEAPTKRKEAGNFSGLRKFSFLREMMVVVFFFWAIMNILEFQYTKAIQQDVFEAQEQTLVLEDYEHLIAQKLGTLHLIFNSAALLMQLVVASRIITSLGITSSMMLHPLVTMINVLAMIFQFNFFTASLARGSHELTGILFKSSYDSSYYAIPHHLRRDAKEFMQGLMKPLGAIMGTLGIFFVAYKLTGLDETLALNAILLLLGAGMAFVIARMNKSYTALSEQNLSHKMDLPTRINAVEILAQKGHEKVSPALQTLLRRPQEPAILKEKILETLGLVQDPEAIAGVLDMIKNENEEIRLAAIQALSHYERLKKHIMAQSITRYRVLEVIKEALEKEKNERIMEQLIYVFHQIEPENLTQFLMGEIKNKRVNTALFIRMLRLFKDPNLKYYLEEYLIDKNSANKAAAIVALWQFKTMRPELTHHLQTMLESKKEEILELGIETVGQIKEYAFRKTLKSMLRANHSEKIRKSILLALIHLEDENAIPHLLDHFFHHPIKFYDVSNRFKRIVQSALELHIIDKINGLLCKHHHLSLKEMSKETLELLSSLYTKVNAHREVHQIKKVLDSRERGSL